MDERSERVRIIRRVHALAKELFGDEPIEGIPAYVFWTRVWAKMRFGVTLRREMTLEQWIELENWLKNLYKKWRDRHAAPSV